MNDNQYKIYRHLLENTPLYPDGARHRGNSAHDAYWNGYDGFKNRYIRGSYASAAFQAGRAAGRRVR